MSNVKIVRSTYANQVRGAWMGFNIGSTLGVTIDGRVALHQLQYYDPVPGQAAANDDMDLQLLAVHALGEAGPALEPAALASLWVHHVAYQWDEIGCALRNLARGLEPPMSGSFDNWFRESIGGAARSMLWGLVAPASPQAAAALAHGDAGIDHATEGVWCAMYWAALVSAAFGVADRRRLAHIGLAMVPATSRVARAARAAMDVYARLGTAMEARAAVVGAADSSNWSDGPLNVGLSVLALLFGGGRFGNTVCTAANCGYAAASTAAMVGGLAGVLTGASALPAEWTEPIGDTVIPGWGLRDVPWPRTVGALSEATVAAAENMVASRCPDVAFVDALPDLPHPPDPTPTTQQVPASAEDAPVKLNVPLGGEEVAEPALGGESSAEAEGFVEMSTPPPPDLAGAEDALTVDPKPDPLAEDSAVPHLGGPVSDAGPAVEPVVAPSPVSPAPQEIDWAANAAIKPLLITPDTATVCRAGQFAVTIDYRGTPALVPNTATSVTVEVRNLGTSEFVGLVELRTPVGWQVAVPGAQANRQILAAGRKARYGFVVRVPESVPLAAQNAADLVLTPGDGPPVICPIEWLGAACWWFVGPLRNQMDEGFHRAYEPEDNPDLAAKYLCRAAGLVGWQKMAFAETCMPLEPIFTGSAGVAYGSTTVHVPVPTAARISVWSNDGVKVWLNRQLVYQLHSHDEFRPSPSSGAGSAVQLRAGDNRIMVKVVRCDHPCEFALAITDPDGRAFEGVATTRW